MLYQTTTYSVNLNFFAGAREKTGIPVKNRGNGYKFGFNGMEKDDEVKGKGNSYDFGARMYDSRLGRWLSLDPLMIKYPSINPYSSCANNPITFIDGDGRLVILGKNFIGSPWGVLYNSVINQGNSVLIGLLNRFQGESSPNITLAADDKQHEDAFADPYYEGFESIKYVLYNLSTDITETVTYNAGTSSEVKLTRTTDLSVIGRSVTLIHEIIHANISQDILEGKLPANSKKEAGGHKILVEKYMDQLLSAITELNVVNEWGLTNDQIELVAWKGMEQTEKFRTEFMVKKYGVALDEDRSKWTQEQHDAYKKYDNDQYTISREETSRQIDGGNVTPTEPTRKIKEDEE